MSSRRTVHIPIVQPGALGGGEDRLIEVYTQHEAFDRLSRHEEEESRRTDAKARDKDWDRVAAPLRKVGLYQAGCAAASAVRKLGIKRPLTALYQQVSRLAWIEAQRLHPAGAQGPTEGRSAELGLALVLLMCASGTHYRQIIGTGALGGQPHGIEEDDVEVLPVGSLPEKLQLVLTLARHQALPSQRRGRELLFFTPKTFEVGGNRRLVEELPELAALREHGVRVVPVARLSEAAAFLRARQARHLIADRVAAGFLMGVICATGVGAAWSAVRDADVPMTFVPAGVGAVDPQPFQACFTETGYYPVPLERAGVAFNIPVGQTLAWKVQVGTDPAERDGLSTWFGPDRYYVAQVMVSEYSRARVMVPEQPGSGAVEVPSGGAWEWGWRLNDEPEISGLVLLARPGAPFDPAQLHEQLIDRFPRAADDSDTGPALDVTAAVNYVANLAPGSVRFFLETVEADDRC